jgi:CRP/FNR family transcriptional regulator
MDGQNLIAQLRTRYPSLAGVLAGKMDAELQADIRILDVVAGTSLFAEGSPCAGFPLVLEGQIRVARLASNGRSLELYRVVPGEICVVSAAGLFGHGPLIAQGSATSATRLALVSRGLFERWTEHIPFRQLVFGVFADRLAELTTLLEAVAFQRLDRRLAEYLLGHGRYVRATHQAIADELGTVREIVTRLLNRFEALGAVALGRERIELIDAVALREIASGQRASL